MTAKVDPHASVQAGHCCFCGKSVISGSEEVTRKRVTVETTAGSSCEFNYHEACFQEWFGNREHAPASVPNPDQGLRTCWFVKRLSQQPRAVLPGYRGQPKPDRTTEQSPKGVAE